MRTALKLTAIALAAALTLLAAGCRSNNQGKTKANPANNKYELPGVPAMITSQDEAMDYIVAHYWDRFYSEDRPGAKDTALVCGFTHQAFDELFCQFALFLRAVTPDKGLKACTSFLDKTEAQQKENPDGTLWAKVTDTYETVLKDPNSPWRNEEYCIPLLEKQARGGFSTEEVKLRAEKDLPRFCLNRLGEKAADFAFTLRNGREITLYGIDAEYTIIFFSNPGCPNCREVMEELQNLPGVDNLIAGKILAVANVYPDEDLSEWLKYSELYPKNWLNGYDHLMAVQNTPLYNLRAIPSVYLLDGEKRVILKDAPTDYLMQYLKMLFGL